jgi:hypothetical protein
LLEQIPERRQLEQGLEQLQVPQQLQVPERRRLEQAQLQQQARARRLGQQRLHRHHRQLR